MGTLTSSTPWLILSLDRNTPLAWDFHLVKAIHIEHILQSMAFLCECCKSGRFGNQVRRATPCLWTRNSARNYAFVQVIFGRDSTPSLCTIGWYITNRWSRTLPSVFLSL